MRRAAARLQLGQPAAALEDAVAVLSIDDSHLEALRLEVKLRGSCQECWCKIC